MKRGDETVIQSSRVGPELPLESRRSLEAVLEIWLADAFVLAEYGHEREAAIIGKLIAHVETAAADWLTWLTEPQAIERSARSLEWLRARFKRWEGQGHARRTPGGARTYRAIIVPEEDRRRPSPATRSAFEAGLRGERPSKLRRAP
jgi:hypothetical protein